MLICTAPYSAVQVAWFERAASRTAAKRENPTFFWKLFGTWRDSIQAMNGWVHREISRNSKRCDRAVVFFSFLVVADAVVHSFCQPFHVLEGMEGGGRVHKLADPCVCICTSSPTSMPSFR